MCDRCKECWSSDYSVKDLSEKFAEELHPAGKEN